MRVISQFVDARNGKRYNPGDGNKINPALASDQAERLKKAGCLADGDEKVLVTAPAPKLEKEGNNTPDYSAMNAQALKELASGRKLDMGGVRNKADLVALLTDADKAAEVAGQAGGNDTQA